ncbi:MAG: Flp family type IVb pilin [Hyphomicrobiales bacterium]
MADERAATAIEYGLISSGIGVVMLAGVDMAGKAVNWHLQRFRQCTPQGRPASTPCDAAADCEG